MSNRIIHRATADTDCTIIEFDGAFFAVVEDGNPESDGCIGYYHRIIEGHYVHSMCHGYSYYLEGGKLESMHGEPGELKPLPLNDGSQEILMTDADMAELLT